MDDTPILETGFNGLSRAQASLSASWYYDPDHFQREMDQIWARNWIYLCRADELQGPRSFRTFKIAGQSILLGSISIYYAWRPVIEHTMNKIMGAAHGSSGFFGVA